MRSSKERRRAGYVYLPVLYTEYPGVVRMRRRPMLLSAAH